MVVFTCNNCGESLQKPKVEKHFSFSCRGAKNLTCVDCFKDFKGEEYVTHIKCVTENQRYGGKDYIEKAKKGEVKQESWMEMIKSILMHETNITAGCKNLLNSICNFNNVPRKKQKFVNFIKSSTGGRSSLEDIEGVWDLIEKHKKENATNANGEKRKLNDENPEGTLNGSELTKDGLNEGEPTKKKNKHKENGTVHDENDKVENNSNENVEALLNGVELGKDNLNKNEPLKKKKKNKQKGNVIVEEENNTEEKANANGEKRKLNDEKEGGSVNGTELVNISQNEDEPSNKKKKNKHKLNTTLEVDSNKTEDEKKQLNQEETQLVNDENKNEPSKKKKKNKRKSAVEIENNSEKDGLNEGEPSKKKKKNKQKEIGTIKVEINKDKNDLRQIEGGNELVTNGKISKKNKMKGVENQKSDIKNDLKVATGDEEKKNGLTEDSINLHGANSISLEKEIEDIVTKKGTISRSKLEKIIFKKYKSIHGDDVNLDKFTKKFNKKLKKIQGIIIDNDTVKVQNE